METWSHLGCFRENVVIFSCEGLVKGLHMKKQLRKYVLKPPGMAQIGLLKWSLFKLFNKNPCPFRMRVPNSQTLITTIT